jgi:hypothetical protein
VAISTDVKKEIREYLIGVLEKKIKKYEPETDYAPFINSLIRDKPKLNSYSIIHSIQTSLGMSMHEQVSKRIAQYGNKFDEAETQWDSEIMVSRKRVAKIDEILRQVTNGTRKPNRQTEQDEILAIDNDDLVAQKSEMRVDVYLRRGNDEFYFDIKTVKPNKPGFSSHKKRILTWIARANKPIHSAIVFPYNPYHPEPYHRGVGYEIMSPDDVMIGKDYWDFLGGKGCYEEVLDLYEQVGKNMWTKLKEKIERD